MVDLPLYDACNIYFYKNITRILISLFPHNKKITTQILNFPCHCQFLFYQIKLVHNNYWFTLNKLIFSAILLLNIITNDCFFILYAKILEAIVHREFHSDTFYFIFSRRFISTPCFSGCYYF